MIRLPAPLLGLGAALSLVACGDAEPPRPRGVVLISIDSLRADHLGCYGYLPERARRVPVSPHIDRLLAEEGTLFERVTSTTSWTLPAHMAMLTGKPDPIHGVTGPADRLHPSHVLLAESFERAGWRTGGFWSGPNLHPWFGFDRGFEVYVDCSEVEVADPEVFRATDEGVFEQVLDIHDRSHSTVTGPLVVEQFGEWFEELGEDESFFAFLHLWDVHYDYEPPPAHDLFFPDYDGPLVSGRFEDFASLPRGSFTDADRDRFESYYDGEIHFTDQNVGEILARLSASGRLDDTLVILTSDHGEEFFEHKSFGHKQTLFEESVRTPLILRYPAGVPAAQRVPELVGLVDIAPTVLDLCGLARPEGMWGRSLRPAFEGRLEPRPQPLDLESPRMGLSQRGYHAGDVKVIWLDTAEEPVFFDLRPDRDPGEKHGRAASRAPGNVHIRRAEELWRQLDEEAANQLRMGEGRRPDDLTNRLIDTGYLGEDDESSGDGEAPGADRR